MPRIRQTPIPRLIATAQVAEKLSRDVRTIHRMVADGRLVPAMKIPGAKGAYLFAESDVDDLRRRLAAGKRRGADA